MMPQDGLARTMVLTVALFPLGISDPLQLFCTGVLTALRSRRA